MTVMIEVSLAAIIQRIIQWIVSWYYLLRNILKSGLSNETPAFNSFHDEIFFSRESRIFKSFTGLTPTMT